MLTVKYLTRKNKKKLKGPFFILTEDEARSLISYFDKDFLSYEEHGRKVNNLFRKISSSLFSAN